MNPYGEETLEDETTPRGCAGNKSFLGANAI